MEVLVDALRQGIAPAIIVGIYLIITKIIDNKKEAYQTKLGSELINSIHNISNFIVNLNKNVIIKDKDKCKNAIKDSIYSSGMRLINFVSSTIINNHIDVNKDNIFINIHNIVNAEYYNVYSKLSMYIINDEKVSEYLDKSWIEDIENDIKEVVYSNKLSKEDRILAFSNKLNIRFQNYITYIENNIF